MEAAGAGGDHDLPLEDVDALLASFSGDPAVFVPPPEPVVYGESPGEGLWEVERFLMEGADEAAVVDGADEFLDDVLAGDEEGRPVGGGSTDGASAMEDEEAVGVDGDDPNCKKKRRQIRNRDSAMKSRERKKMYVKNLEMKSKYLEAECRRLSYALQCCAAENMALRQCLLKDRPVGAPTAMQESAVLMGTLPLVSLLWLVSIVCLLLTPGLPNRSPVAPSNLERDLVMVAGTTNGDEPETLEIIRHGRRCKGTRARIKLPLLPWHGAAAC